MTSHPPPPPPFLLSKIIEKSCVLFYGRNLLVLSILEYNLSLSAFVKIHDVPLTMFCYVRRSLHLISYPNNGVPLIGQCIVYYVSSNAIMYLSKKVSTLRSPFHQILIKYISPILRSYWTYQ